MWYLEKLSISFTRRVRNYLPIFARLEQNIHSPIIKGVSTLVNSTFITSYLFTCPCPAVATVDDIPPMSVDGVELILISATTKLNMINIGSSSWRGADGGTITATFMYCQEAWPPGRHFRSFTELYEFGVDLR